MTDNDLDRTLADWFDGDARAAAPAGGLDRAIEAARRRKPRPAWVAGPGSHWGWDERQIGPGIGVRAARGQHVRWSTAVALVAIAGALLAGAALIGARLLESPTPQTRSLATLAYAVDGDIFVADWDGQNPVRIADGLPGGKSGCGSAGYWAEGPMWSPDGRHLAYRSPRSQVDCARPEADTFPTVLLSDPEGHVVAEFPGVGWQIAWSPDSTRVATWLDLYPGTKIGVYGLDGERQAVIDVPEGSDQTCDCDPVWSPDGESLLVPMDDGDPSDDGANLIVDIWELPIDGRPARILPKDDPRSHFSWASSPLGTRAAYVVDEPMDYIGALTLAQADGSQPRELFASARGIWQAPPVWSPVGDRIAFVSQSTSADGQMDPSTTELRVADVANGSVTIIVPANGEGLTVRTFSSDGDRILLSRDSGLWSVDADGSNLRLLVSGFVFGADWRSASGAPDPTPTASPIASTDPDPTPTASPRPLQRLGHLAYSFDGDIFVADWDGQNPVRIADGHPDPVPGCGSARYRAEGPMWSPDGRHLAYRSPVSQVNCPDADTASTVLLSDPEGHVVAEFPGAGWRVAWSPDSTRVATWLDLYPMTKIGIYGLDGVRQAVIDMPVGTDIVGDDDPIWSPDGESVLIQRSTPGYGYVVWELPIGGGPPRRLAADEPLGDWSSRRSPDGYRVAYVTGEGGALVVTAADGSQPRELASGVNHWRFAPPVWSPSGDRLAFAAGGRYDVEPSDLSKMELRVVDVASGSVTTLAPAKGAFVLDFSPEGDRVLFTREDGLWSVDVDGSDLQLLASDVGLFGADWQSVPADQD